VAIEIGDEIPEFSLKDQIGETVSKEDLLGSPFVLYFYPKDDTPGCTKEACSFRDEMEAFDSLEVLVVGVSADNEKSHQKFSDKHELNFPLLADVNHTLCEAFGVIKANGDKKGIERSTFLFDEDGLLAWMEKPVQVEGHVERVLEAISELQENI
jgi:thioredoxin-dependent peroxiredoxin